MAVVLEIEISELFGCRNLAAPTCDKASVDRQLDEMYRLGVRSSLLLNKFDNPLAGVRFDSGAVRGGHQRRQQEQRRLVLERRDVQGPAHRQRDLRRVARGQRCARRPIRLGGGGRWHRPHLSARAALQHPRAHPAGQARGQADDGSGDDREPGPHEPARRGRHPRPARDAQVLRRHLAARLDGPGQLAAAVEARRDRVPRPQQGHRLREGVPPVPPAPDSVPARLGPTAPTLADCPTSPTPAR